MAKAIPISTLFLLVIPIMIIASLTLRSSLYE
jgi:hypothetical protein